MAVRGVFRNAVDQTVYFRCDKAHDRGSAVIELMLDLPLPIVEIFQQQTNRF